MNKLLPTLKWTLIGFLLIAAGTLTLTIFYPANPELATWTPPRLPQNLEVYLQAEEALIHPKPGTEKGIIWNSIQKNKTPYSLVYLHGFSATRREVSPVVEDLGSKFHSNIFFTRLHGHGLGVKDFDQASALEWVQDANEALEIGKRLGEKVILIGTSTGVPLALHLASQKDPAIAALVLISANFRPYRGESILSAGPLGEFITELLIGKEGYSWHPRSPENAYFWTTTFPPGAIHTLMELLKYANKIDLHSIEIPSLWIYTHKDTVVNTELIQEKFQTMGSRKKKIVDTGAPSHVLAGAIVNPGETEKVESLALDFLTSSLK
ncbi:MAG: alpha/beta hydrolase [Pseudobdellovibrionaceae bacterium]